MTRWTKSQKKEWELWIDSHYTKEERRKEFLIKAARVLLWALLVVSIVILAMMIGG